MMMAHETIPVTDMTNWLALLDAATQGPVILERGAERLRLSRVDDLFPDYDPDRMRDG